MLILSIGSLVGHNLMQALAERREHVFIVATNSIPQVANNFAADVAYLVPRAEREQEHVDAIARIIAAEQPDLVIPSRDDDVLALGRLKQRFAGDAVLLVGSLAAAEIMNDKKRTAEFAESHGLPFAPTADEIGEAKRFGAKFGFRSLPSRAAATARAASASCGRTRSWSAPSRCGPTWWCSRFSTRRPRPHSCWRRSRPACRSSSRSRRAGSMSPR